MEGIELRKAIEEARSLVGARLSKVHQVSDVFFLRFYRPSGALALDPGGKALHRTALRPPAPPLPPSFCMRLRALAGQPLLSLDQAGLDRVVRLKFPGADLILDLRPRQGNLFFLPEDAPRSSLRGGELRPVDFSAADDLAVGLGSGLRRAAAAFLGHPPSPEELGQFLSALLARDPAGFLYTLERGPVASFFPRPDLGEPQAVFPTFFQALDVLLERRLGEFLARQERARVERDLARRRRALEALGAAAAEAQRWPEVQAQADLILTRQGGIPRGASEAWVEGFDGQPVLLKLDPALPPVAQAQVLYAKARKLRRRLEEIPKRREKLQEEISALEKQRDLFLLRPELAPYLKEPPSPRQRGPRATPREVVIESFPIRIGRSAEENDRLVRLAHPDDLWLHARGVPGAHVVIRTDGRHVPSEVLQRAAELAAWHSRARGERKVQVSYTPVRYVRRPKGGLPGMVTLLREEVLIVRGDRGP